MQRFTELKVWQRAHALVLEIYRISASFPQEERFGVTSQLRRAITSVPTNIAEGSRRQGQQEYSRFLDVAQSSAAETEYLLILCRDLGYLPPAAFDRLTADPPATVVADPELDGAGQVAGNGDLLGAPSGEGHGEVEDRMAGPSGAATVGLAASDLALKEAAAQDLLQRRQGRGDPGPPAKEGCGRGRGSG